MKKELYLSPFVELDEFDKKDIITTSQGVPANETDPEGLSSWSDPVR